MQITSHSELIPEVATRLVQYYGDRMSEGASKFGPPTLHPELDGRIDIFLEDAIQFAATLRSHVDFVNRAVEFGLITWNAQLDHQLKGWFESWVVNTKLLRGLLADCLIKGSFQRKTSKFLEADLYVKQWLMDQEAYELGELTAPISTGGDLPDSTWYDEAFVKDH